MSERNRPAWPSFVLVACLTAACTSPSAKGPTLAPRPTILPSATRRPTAASLPPSTSIPHPSPAPWRVTSAVPFEANPASVERSSDGQWTANSFGDYPPIFMQVARADGFVTWEVRYSGEDWPEVWIRPVHWSVDGRYLYFTLAPFVDGFILYMDGSGLLRLDLVTGDLMELLPSDGRLQSFSLSPDSTRLVFFRADDDDTWAVVRDLRQGHEDEFKLAARPVQAGAVRWAPDGSAFVVLATSGFSLDEARTDLVLVDLRNVAQKTVLTDDPRTFWRIDWVDANSVYLEDFDGSGWLLDLRSGEMVLTPTPAPTP